MHRKLAAILSADVVGYGRLMEADEGGVLERLKTNRISIFEPNVTRCEGRIFKSMGDGALAEFASVVAAVSCALAIQEASEKAEPNVNEGNRIRYRIGVNLGEVIIEGDDVYGEGVNVAARLQSLALPGGVAVSRVVRDQVDGKLPCVFEDIGERVAKNHERPVHVFFVRTQDTAAATMRVTPSHHLSLPNKPSIAVLPFTNLSGDSEQDYFADGMVEEITTALSRFKSIFVIASGSGHSFKGKVANAHEIGRQLGVRYLLQGSVRKAANRVRIAVKLLDAADGSQVWAGRFEDTLDDVFALQDKVAVSIAGVVEPALDALETRRAVARPAVDMDSYDLWLRASSLWRTFADDDVIECLALLNQALKLDPHFALAAAMAAWAHGYMRANRLHGDPQQHHRDGIDLGNRALRLGSDDPDVLVWVALSRWLLGEDLDAAIELMNRGLALNPGSAQNWYFSTFLQLAAGNPDIVIEQLEKSTRLDPLSSPNKPLLTYVWGFARFLQGRFDEATAFLKEAVQRTDMARAYSLLAASSAHVGQISVARQALARRRELIPTIPVEQDTLALFSKPEHQEFFRSGISLADDKSVSGST